MGDEPVNPYYLRDSYAEFLATEGVPVVEGFSVDCLTLPLEPWPRLGGRGAYVHLAGRGEFLSCYVAEIPPTSQSGSWAWSITTLQRSSSSRRHEDEEVAASSSRTLNSYAGNR